MSDGVQYSTAQDVCTHGNYFPAEGTAQFKDLDKMRATQIRDRYPRFEGTCPLCGWHGIHYASYAQFIYGDY